MRWIFAFFLVLGAACSQNPHRQGLELLEAGEIEAGLAKLDQATRAEPSNRAYRQTYFRQRDIALQRFFGTANTARQRGQWEAAEALYKRMLAIDPQNPRATAALASLSTDRRHRATLAEADELFKKGNTALAEARVRGVLAENGTNREAQSALRRIEERMLRTAASGPQLGASLKEPISLEIRDGMLRQVFEALSRSTGLNFLFDRDVRQEMRTTVFVRNSTVEDVLRFILVTNQLEKKVLSENTVLVYPNNANKAREYQDLVTKSFYLANSDAKATGSMVRALVKTKDMYVDEKINLLVIRDTPDAVRMAERLIAAQDLAEPEVMLELEVLEVNSTVLYDIGVRYPDSVNFSLVGAAGTPGTITLKEWHERSSDLVRLTVPTPFLGFSFRNELGRSNVLANPRIRVKNKDKAKIHIGDKVPVITSTTTATGVVSESVTYLDVGLKLEVEPLVFLEDDVGIKIALEVSNIAREIRSQSGALTYQVGTRNAVTNLRLKDGETQILAGLISEDERKTVTQIPGLGDLPVVGRLFGSHLDNGARSEVVLLVTPRVIRNVTRPQLQFEEFPSGTDAAIGAAPLMLQTLATQPVPAAAVSTQPAPVATGGAPKLLLQAPLNVTAGKEFEVQLGLESAVPARSGLLDFAFDASRLRFIGAEPGALIIGADPSAAFRATAPEGIGRLNISFTSKGDLNGRGELAKLRFQALDAGATAPTIRLEAASLTSAAGNVVSAQLPAPLTLNVTR